jgi:hypothetical protein
MHEPPFNSDDDGENDEDGEDDDGEDWDGDGDGGYGDYDSQQRRASLDDMSSTGGGGGGKRNPGSRRASVSSRSRGGGGGGKGRRGRRRSSQLSRMTGRSSGGGRSNGGGGDRPPSGWGWAIYLDRSMVSDVKGNLVVSVGVNAALRGLTFTVFDPRTHREAFRLVSFFDACNLADRSLDALENDLGNMDESLAYDLADEFLAMAEVSNSDEDKLSMLLVGDSEEFDDMLLARLGEYRRPADGRPDWRVRQRASVPVQRVSIRVHGAKDLERIGAFGTRYVYICICIYIYMCV